MSLQVFAVRISRITNRLLMHDGWQVGNFVRETDETFTGATSYARCAPHNATFYETRASADLARTHGPGSHFGGVEFETVCFTRGEWL
jgi:hypothetical protein